MRATHTILFFLGSLFLLGACGSGEASPEAPPAMLVDSPAENEEGSSEVESPEEPEESEPENALTFIDDILPVIQNRCSACHSEGSGLPFWEDYDVTFARRDNVRLRVFVIQDMPRNNLTGMTPEERQLFADWIDQGAAFE